MVSTRAYHGLSITVAHSTGNRICYIILPEGLQTDGTKMIESAAERYSCHIAVISGINWNADLTPWPAPGVFKKEKPFDGKAKGFLQSLLTDVFPSIELSLGIHNPEAYLAGVSLSGLFAVWTLWNTQKFRGIASISGSLWYDGFTEWTRCHPLLNTEAKVFLSLGDKEKDTKNPLMANVEISTSMIAEILETSGCEVDYRIVQGTHFSPLIPRLELALKFLLSLCSDGTEDIGSHD